MQGVISLAAARCQQLQSRRLRATAACRKLLLEAQRAEVIPERTAGSHASRQREWASRAERSVARDRGRPERGLIPLPVGSRSLACRLGMTTFTLPAPVARRRLISPRHEFRIRYTARAGRSPRNRAACPSVVVDQR